MWFILLRPRPPPETAEDVLHFLQEDLLDAGLVEASRKWLPNSKFCSQFCSIPPEFEQKIKVSKESIQDWLKGACDLNSAVYKNMFWYDFFSRELIVGSLPVTTFCSKEIRSPKRQDTTGLTWLAAFFLWPERQKKDLRQVEDGALFTSIYILLPHANTHESILCHLYISILWALSIKWSSETWIKRTRTSPLEITRVTNHFPCSWLHA